MDTRRIHKGCAVTKQKNIWYFCKETIPSGIRQVLFLNEEGFLIRFLACNKIGLGEAIGKHYTSHVHLPRCHRTLFNVHMQLKKTSKLKRSVTTPDY